MVASAGSLASAADEPTTNTQNSTEQTTQPEPVPLFQIHYDNRVRSFKEQNLVYQNVVLLGDSITEGFDATKYFPGRRVLNRGIGSDVIGNDVPANDKRGVLKRLDCSVFNCSPTDIFLLIGINDLGQGHSPETIEAGYRELLTQIQERLPKVKIHVESLLPCRDRFAKHNANVLEINRRIKALAGELDCDYIDLHSQFADEKGELKADFTHDGLHVTEPAYDIWTSIIEEKMGWNK
jgi:lysophospholipase L1-like esterase